jgi:non-heme chloroperoxidase
MDAVGLDAAVIVGHSGGSNTAQRFAIDHPERTLGTVLIGSFRSFHDNPGMLELGRAASELPDRPSRPRIRARVPGELREAADSGRLLRGDHRRERKLPVRVWQAYLRGIVEADVPTETGTITGPP